MTRRALQQHAEEMMREYHEVVEASVVDKLVDKIQAEREERDKVIAAEVANDIAMHLRHLVDTQMMLLTLIERYAGLALVNELTKMYEGGE
jgi:hypothetical protein